MAKSEVYLTFILSELEKGTDRAKCLAKFGNKWQTATRTFDRLWKKAKERHTETEQAIQKDLADSRTAELKDGLNEAIKSDLELEMILCQIATANIEVGEWIKGGLVVRNVAPSEQVAAIAQLFKKRGSYAPTKTAQTDKDGNDVVPITQVEIVKPIPLDED